MSFSDIDLTCKDCGQPFVFTAGEQEFYQQRGLMNQPGRCVSCRGARRGGGANTSSGGAREMFTATCSQCGQEARVPFQPRGDKPIYCSSCFETKRPARRD
ncbi:MAG: zinc-ribbon domain containing protein [Chloroflexota bacterium]|nr:zinc-ribbon domain containing protein [Chloroflexota bacterium]